MRTKTKLLTALITTLLVTICSAALNITIATNPNGLPTITVHDVGPGYVWVEYSTNLSSTNWTPFGIALNVFSTPATYSFTDPFASNHNQRYYRAYYLYARPVFTNGVSAK